MNDRMDRAPASAMQAPGSSPSMSRLLLAVLSAVGLLLVASSVLQLTVASSAPGEYHEDTKYGYKVKSPKGWGYVPMGADEKWIAGKFLSDKGYTWTDPDTNMGGSFKPVMQVIVFIDEVVKMNTTPCGALKLNVKEHKRTIGMREKGSV